MSVQQSNMEQTKGEASDSFKRACFSVGIGRELILLPLFGSCYQVAIFQRRGEKFYCAERFRVATISYGEKSGKSKVCDCKF